MNIPFHIILLDLETNGLDIPEVRITEIGAVRLNEKLNIMDEYSQLVDGRPVTPHSTSITSITDAMLEGQPTFEQVLPKFAEWVGKSKSYILSSWGTYFDISVLRSECRRVRVKYPFHGAALDVKAVALWTTWKDGFKGGPATRCGVDSACKLFGVEFKGTRHRALDDAKAEAMILQKVARLDDRKESKP
ncbi:MAG: exonuclease domain-containing protein [Methylococcales bacterium]